VARSSERADPVSEEAIDTIVDLLRAAYIADRRALFSALEERGLHVTPVHFYMPIPDTRALPPSLWEHESELPGLDLNADAQLELVRNVFPRYRSEYSRIPSEPTDSEQDFYLDNTMFGGMDALILYCMIRHFEPSLVLEIGSGLSSRLISQAARANGATEHVSIDPFPHRILSDGLLEHTSLIEKPVEQVGLDVFKGLQGNDILFIDSSHVVRCGGDVNYLFLEAIPRLAPGVIVHIHDIFLPAEYPEEWVKDEHRFWSEQYLLQAFLAFNREFEVLLSLNYLGHRHWRDLAEAFPNAMDRGGGSFWMRRKA
jgi:predicted O-methyltransferase YrrM